MATNSPQSSSSCKLTSNDLPQVLNSLSSISPLKVINFGLALNVTRNEITNFEIRYSQNMDDCLREILNRRLSQLPPLTWQDIVTALRSPLVNDLVIARVIESQYISLDLQQHPAQSSQQESTDHETSHMTGIHHSVQPQTQYSSNPTPQSHTALIPTPSANSTSTGYPVHSLHSTQSLSQPPQPVNTDMYSLSSFQSYHHYQPPLHHSQIKPLIPRYTSPYHPSIYPFPQWQPFLPPQPLHIPPPSIHQSVPSSDQSSSSPTSTVASQSSLQCTQQGSVHSSSIPHEQPSNTQPGYSIPHAHSSLMYPSRHKPPDKAITLQPYPTIPHILATRPLQDGVVGGQWDSQSYMSHYQPQTSYTKSQRNSSMESHTMRPYLQSNPELSHTEGNQRDKVRSSYSTLLATHSTSPEHTTHQLNHTPYIDVVNQHSDILTETISGDLTFFINKFIELGFVTRTATANVLSQHGVGNGEKAGQLLSLVTAHYKRTRNKEKWFDKFVGVFSSEPAYEDLADMMTVALEKMRWSDFGSSETEPLPQLEKSPLFRSPMDAFVHYIKVRYKQCEIERNLDVLKWPPTPSKIFINLACIDWESVVSKEEADEYTRAMVEDGNVDVIMKKKTNINFEDIARDLPAPNSPKRLVLVEGAPGVGKSTFAWNSVGGGREERLLSSIS